MEQSYLSRERSKYITPLNPEKTDVECLLSVGSASQLDSTFKNVPWASAASETNLEEVEFLQLAPSVDELTGQPLLPLLGSLPKLKCLSIPYPLVPKLRGELLPKTLRCIQIYYPYAFWKIWPPKDIQWPSQLQLPDVESLFLATDYDTSDWRYLKLHRENFPNLKYIKCSLDGKATALKSLASFASLDHAELSRVLKVDLFEALPSDLSYLTIEGLGPQFPLEKILSLKNLKALQINGADTRREINCELFTSLDQLVELNILNCKLVTNAEALLGHKTLKSLSVLNSKNPFTAKTRELFEDQGFERLDIKYA